VEALYDGRP